MDLFTLDGNNFKPVVGGIVEGYSSLIWTERYSTPGDFELHTGEISTSMAKLPIGTLVAILESDEIMRVETHELSYDDAGKPELVIKGRSLISYIEHRYLRGKYGKKAKTAKQYNLGQLLEVLLWNAFVNNTTTDVTRNQDFSRNKADRIPKVVVTHSAGSVGKSKRRWLTPGELQPQFETFQTSGRLGVRVIRPDSVGNIVTFETDATNKGDRSVESGQSIVNQIRFDVYKGDNVSNKVTIKHLEDLTTPKYTISDQTYKSAAYVDSDQGGQEVSRDDESRIIKPRSIRNLPDLSSDLELTGLDRRMMYVDGGSKDDGETKAEFLEDLPDIGRDALAGADNSVLLDGQVNADSLYKYGIHYGLGDIVAVQGSYGFSDLMVVAEYIRTEDADGDSAYPTLAVL